MQEFQGLLLILFVFTFIVVFIEVFIEFFIEVVFVIIQIVFFVLIVIEVVHVILVFFVLVVSIPNHDGNPIRLAHWDYSFFQQFGGRNDGAEGNVHVCLLVLREIIGSYL